MLVRMCKSWVSFPLIASFILLAGVSRALGQPEIIATMRHKNRQIHAIVSPVMFGFENDNFTDKAGRNEFPIRTTVQLKEPRKKLRILVNGVLFSPAHDDRHADAVYKWKGYKCATLYEETGFFGGKSLKVRPGPLANMVPHEPPFKILVTYEGSMGLKRYPVPTIDKPDQEELHLIHYSFRANRLYFKIEAEQNVTHVGFDASALDSEYCGMLRVHVFDDTPVRDDKGNGYRVRFEEYGLDPDFQNAYDTKTPPLCRSVRLLPEKDFPWPGDFLFPVGITLTPEAKDFTRRTLTGLTQGKETKATVQGLFIFSGFSVPGNPKPPKHMFGGGGGLQDPGFRFDHLRPRRPAIYPVATTWFNSEMKIYRASTTYRIRGDSSNEWVKSLSDPYDINRLHSYEVKFVPEGTSVSFEVRDGGQLSKTWDNSGAFFVTVHP